MDFGLQDSAAKPTEYRSPQVAVQRGHCLWFDPPGEAIAHDQISSALERFHEGLQVFKVVAVVGVAHDDPLALGPEDPAAEYAPVTAGGNTDYPGSPGHGNGHRAVATAVVGDQDLAGHLVAGQVDFGLVNAGPDRLSLVETRHEDRKVGTTSHGSQMLAVALRIEGRRMKLF